MGDWLPIDEYKSAFTIKNILKYLIEGLAIAIAAFLIPNRKTSIVEVLLLGLIASLSFFVLDVFAPATGVSARQGAGFGIGYSLVNSPPVGYPLKGAMEGVVSGGKTVVNSIISGGKRAINYAKNKN
jgi:hypothetical protein